jgi:hypothetical protein
MENTRVQMETFIGTGGGWGSHVLEPTIGDATMKLMNIAEDLHEAAGLPALRSLLPSHWASIPAWARSMIW